MTAPADFRSDTVTQPCARMRSAMLEAKLGDDVYGEDPTVNLLQERVAELLGKQAALFTPTGSMADQIAVQVLTRPGDAIVTAPDSHIAFHEAGATPMLSGVQFSFMPSGIFSDTELLAAYHDNDHHFPPTTLVEVENTYNMGGGLVWPLAKLQALREQANALGMHTMMDGARLWNASVASGHSEATLAKGYDLVTVCLSKGLGAPIGSLIAGDAALIRRAHRVRKMLGGGMRQVGMLAAAGLYALEHNRERLAEDHRNARFLAEGIASIDGLTVATPTVDTNIVIVSVDPSLGEAADLQARVQEKGLLFFPTNKTHIRLVTHLDVDQSACERALDILSSASKAQ